MLAVLQVYTVFSFSPMLRDGLRSVDLCNIYTSWSKRRVAEFYGAKQPERQGTFFVRKSGSVGARVARKVFVIEVIAAN